jgi:nucleoside-diphosphate-sugar epimerase
VDSKKTVFLTGASGNMGQETLKLLLKKPDRFNIVVLVLPTNTDRKIMAAYAHEPQLKFIWGDLTNYRDVLEGVQGADYVLHVGGLVSPYADYHPKLTTKVNIGAIKNIVQAIKAQPQPDQIKLVYIGSIAQTGDRNAPIHWGRVGDPIKISMYDNYAITKTIAEREVIESGLKYWVSLRQTGIAHDNLLKSLDPIMYHTPINGVLEWVTVRDSGRLLANLCSENLPEEFWRNIYNIGGGEKFRVTNYEFFEKCFAAIGIKNFRKFFEPNWFALQNFHGQWYEDSDLLESYLHFRQETLEDFFVNLARNTPFYMKLSGLAPAWLIKKLVMEQVAKRKLGPLYWLKHNIQPRISAYFGSKQAWQQIPSWDNFKIERPSAQPVRLQHGYDENKPRTELDLNDMQQAAHFRGGECLADSMTTGDLNTKLKWVCAFGHTFEASPTLVLLGGHWCPECLPAPWNYDAIAKRSPFFAQVWYHHHTPDEANYYSESLIEAES